MTGVIILAAGQSIRLGQPKQNLLFEGKTLLQRAIDTAIDSDCNPVIVVLGANASEISPSAEKHTIFLQNPNWREGMSSSIRVAVGEMIKQGANNTIIMLCDQPFVTTELLNKMLLKQNDTGKPIVACAYKGTTGVPVLFHKTIFPQLLLLKGHEGAKKILQDQPEEIAQVPFEKGATDIDTMADYQKLIGRHYVN